MSKRYDDCVKKASIYLNILSLWRTENLSRGGGLGYLFHNLFRGPPFHKEKNFTFLSHINWFREKSFEKSRLLTHRKRLIVYIYIYMSRVNYDAMVTLVKLIPGGYQPSSYESPCLTSLRGWGHWTKIHWQRVQILQNNCLVFNLVEFIVQNLCYMTYDSQVYVSKLLNSFLKSVEMTPATGRDCYLCILKYVTGTIDTASGRFVI